MFRLAAAISLALWITIPYQTAAAAPLPGAGCNAAVTYLQMADHALEDSEAWTTSSSAAAGDLANASSDVAQHFVAMAAKQFDGTECGAGVFMWWSGDEWATYPYDYLVDNRYAGLRSNLRKGAALLRDWQAKRWDRRYPNEYAVARSGYHRLQIVASLNGVDTSGKVTVARHSSIAAHSSVRPAAAPSSAPALDAPRMAAAPTADPCDRPYVQATVLRAESPDTPRGVRGPMGTVMVDILLDEQSRVAEATVTKTPNPLLNDAAISAARRSRFQTEIRNCKPVPSHYLFSVEFTDQ